MVNLVTVVEMAGFTAWAKKALDGGERDDLTNHLAANPEAGAVIAETGGLRKIRWKRAGQGTRGGYRVIYYYHSHAMPLFVFTGYGKNEKENLSDNERATFRKIVAVLKAKAK